MLKHEFFWYSEQASRQTHLPGMEPLTGTVYAPLFEVRTRFNLRTSSKKARDRFPEYPDKEYLGLCDPSTIISQ